MIISAPNTKQLFAVFLSTAAICAFVSATPVVAQETPQGTAPITAEPPRTPSRGRGNSYDYDPFGAVGAIIAAPFGAITSNTADTTQPEARCQETRDFNDSEARPATVCGP